MGHVRRQHADQGVVVDAVVLPLELHDPVAAGEAACDPDGVHRRFRARHGHACHVAERHLADELRDRDLVLAGEAEADPTTHPVIDMLVDAGIPVTQDRGTVAHAQVDELGTVEVPDQAALATVDVDGVLAPGAEVRIGTAGHGPERPAVRPELALPGQCGRGPSWGKGCRRLGGRAHCRGAVPAWYGTNGGGAGLYGHDASCCEIRRRWAP